MEKILYFVWKHKMFPLSGLVTTSGEAVEVLSPGLPNNNAGPDFLQARIRISDVVWAGNVEIHERSSDWYRHGHDADKAYNNVILHVASIVDTDVKCSNGNIVPQVRLECPAELYQRYQELMHTLHYPPCYNNVGTLPSLKIHDWLSALCIERLSKKSERLIDYQNFTSKDWENTLFIALSRNFGFGINGEAFEMWAKVIPYHALGKHRDNLLQIEAFFFGQAGFLSEESIPECYWQVVQNDEYYKKLSTEYKFLAAKFNLKHIEPHLWKYLRTRPANFPHIRLAQLAMLYHKNIISVSRIIESEGIKAIQDLFDGGVSEYWHTHCNFFTKTEKQTHSLVLKSRRLITINTIVPLLYTYGKHIGKEDICDKAISLLEEMPAEDNCILRNWAECGIKAEHAADSQALLQLKNEYCDRKDCLRCRFGYEYIKGCKKW